MTATESFSLQSVEGTACESCSKDSCRPAQDLVTACTGGTVPTATPTSPQALTTSFGSAADVQPRKYRRQSLWHLDVPTPGKQQQGPAVILAEGRDR